jgi:thiamine-phosphate pyrophosphorylase
MTNISNYFSKTLYAITPDKPFNEYSLESTLELHDISIVQYRRKNTDMKTLLNEAKQIKQVCQKYNTLFIVNDHIELAHLCESDGIHLGGNDHSIFEARDKLGQEAIIGKSCYNSIENALTAQKEGASYVAFGSLFPSKTKPNAPTCSLETIREASSKISIPIVGIGGIDFSKLNEVFEAGCNSIAMVNALFQPSN